MKRSDLKKALLLYAVTDGSGGEILLEKCRLAIEGGVRTIQLRTKGKSDDALLPDALALASLCREKGVLFIVNDSPSLAARSGADGVHIGACDGNIAAARALLPDKIIGVSANTAALALKAQKEGADYIGTGAIFPTNSKDNAEYPGIEGLKAVAGAVSVPVVAIGGINADNIPLLRGCSIDGVCAIEAIFGKEDIKSAAKLLLRRARAALLPLRAAIFDLDGTLLDSMFIWQNASHEYLRGKGIEPKEDLRARVEVMQVVDAAEYLRLEYHLPGTKESIASEINDMIAHYYFDTVLPKEGALELIRLFADKGVKMYIATATAKYLVKAALERLGMDDFFMGIITCTETGSKETPDIYRYALSALCAEKDETVVFEDSCYAALCADNDGFRVASVLDPWELKRRDKMENGTDYYIEDLRKAGELFNV